MSPFPDITDDELLFDDDGALALETLATLLPEGPVSSVRKRALVDSLPGESRLARFAGKTAAMLDVDEPTARVLLEQAGSLSSYTPSPFPGVTLCHVEGGPAVADAITGFVRIVADAAFPEHDHVGEESVLVIQGSCLEMPSGHVFRAGDVVPASPGGLHSVIARPGPDLVYLAVLHGGLKVGDMILLPGDPSI